MCLVFVSESLDIDSSREAVVFYLWETAISVVASYALLLVVLSSARTYFGWAGLSKRLSYPSSVPSNRGSVNSVVKDLLVPIRRVCSMTKLFNEAGL
jgi:hypothetical protein